MLMIRPEENRHKSAIFCFQAKEEFSEKVKITQIQCMFGSTRKYGNHHFL
jgi:hypothetical protein